VTSTSPVALWRWPSASSSPNQDAISSTARLKNPRSCWPRERPCHNDPRSCRHAFERLHGRETYPGSGIGLAIVRKSIERMGGTVGMESHLGKGSRFWIELPRAQDPA
jgi:hypothetical protein